MNNTPPQREEILDELDGRIMNWIYDIVKINFGYDFIQDSTELREIIEEGLKKQSSQAKEDVIERVREFADSENYQHSNKWVGIGHDLMRNKLDVFLSTLLTDKV